MSAFIAPNRLANEWFSVGPATSFPNITEAETISTSKLCGNDYLPGCKVFQVPKENASLATEIDSGIVEEAAFRAKELKDQVLIFQYKGKFHAMDNQCPHSSYPLSNGAAFDIEDFGIVLSAGITCPKHGWSFDLFSGRSDTGNYKLKLWEVQVRPIPGENMNNEQEIWVRRKQRIG